MTTDISAVRYVNLPVRPCRYDRLRPGSLFRVVAEPDRGIRASNDQRIYRRATKNEGFFSTVVGDADVAAVFLPNDVVQPVKVERIG